MLRVEKHADAWSRTGFQQGDEIKGSEKQKKTVTRLR
jgi:hypothetical protein